MVCNCKIEQQQQRVGWIRRRSVCLWCHWHCRCQLFLMHILVKQTRVITKTRQIPVANDYGMAYAQVVKQTIVKTKTKLQQPMTMGWFVLSCDFVESMLWVQCLVAQNSAGQQFLLCQRKIHNSNSPRVNRRTQSRGGKNQKTLCRIIVRGEPNETSHSWTLATRTRGAANNQFKSVNNRQLVVLEVDLTK